MNTIKKFAAMCAHLVFQKCRVLMGFTWTVELLRGGINGVCVDREVIHNLVPLEGLNFNLSALFKAAAVPATWYIAPFEGNYTPIPGDTAAALPAASTECTTYNEATRGAFVAGTVTGGTLDNAASPAVFTFNAVKTIYGGFMTGASAKSATTSTLISAVRFASPKTPAIGDVLRITAGFTFASS